MRLRSEPESEAVPLHRLRRRSCDHPRLARLVREKAEQGHRTRNQGMMRVFDDWGSRCYRIPGLPKLHT